MRARRVAVMSLVGLAVLVGCDNGEPVPRLQPTATVEPECANQEDVVSDDSVYLAGRLEGDVTGDGTSDVVRIAFDASAERGCQAFVVVETDPGSLVAPVDNYDPEFGLTEPRLDGLAAIDDSPGAEILVGTAAGASTQFVTVFTVSDGRLRRVEVAAGSDVDGGVAHDPSADGMFAYGGSVGHLEAVDCAGDGSVVASVAFPVLAEDGEATPLDYEVTRRFYDPSGARWELLEPRTEEAEISIQRLSETFTEFATAPFGNCPAP